MKTSIFSVLSLLGALTVEIDANQGSLLRGSDSKSSTNTDSGVIGRGLQDATNPSLCPEPDPAGSCTREFVPVSCNDCTYHNICSAGAAGYLEDDCERVGQESFECPERDPDLVCKAVFAPVVCDDCEYENRCVASGAGYAVDGCEPLEELFDPLSIPIDPRELCPETGSVACNKMYDPVICKDVCTYGNLCMGVGAGFLKSDCLPDAR